MHLWIWCIETTARNHCSCPIALKSNRMLACIRTPIWNDHWQTCQTTYSRTLSVWLDVAQFTGLELYFVWWSNSFHLLAALALVQAQAQEKHKAWQASHSAAYLLFTRRFAHKLVSSLQISISITGGSISEGIYNLTNAFSFILFTKSRPAATVETTCSVQPVQIQLRAPS